MIVSTALWGSGLYLDRSAVPDSFLKNLTVTSRYEDGDTIQLWSATPPNGRVVKLPRYFTGLKVAQITDISQEGGGLEFTLQTPYRVGQRELLDRFRAAVQTGKTGFLLVAPTGTGKTRIAIEVINILGRRALVVVPKSDLLKQWCRELLLHTDLSEDQIGVGESGSIDWRDKDVVVTLADTLSKDREDPEFKRRFGTVVFDEVDRRIPAKTLHSVMGLMPARYRVAITATPKRRDGLDVLIDYHVAECRITTDVGKKMPATVYALYFTPSEVPYVPSGYGKKVYRRAAILKNLSADNERNLLIARMVSRLVDTGRRCAVVSDRIAQLKNVTSILCNMGVARSDIGFYTRSAPGSEKERKRAVSECNIIMATYGLFGAGTDIPTLSGLVIASPIASSTQIVGRVERYYEGKPEPIVIDIVDTSFTETMGWFNSRLREYRQRGLRVLYHGRRN